MRSTIFDSNANEKIAAAVMLKMPAMVVASKIEMSVELIWSLLYPNAERPSAANNEQGRKLEHKRPVSANDSSRNGVI
jgi:hypothetical protein